MRTSKVSIPSYHSRHREHNDGEGSQQPYLNKKQPAELEYLQHPQSTGASILGPGTAPKPNSVPSSRSAAGHGKECSITLDSASRDGADVYTGSKTNTGGDQRIAGPLTSKSGASRSDMVTIHHVDEVQSSRQPQHSRLHKVERNCPHANGHEGGTPSSVLNQPGISEPKNGIDSHTRSDSPDVHYANSDEHMYWQFQHNELERERDRINDQLQQQRINLRNHKREQQWKQQHLNFRREVDAGTSVPLQPIDKARVPPPRPSRVRSDDAAWTSMDFTKPTRVYVLNQTVEDGVHDETADELDDDTMAVLRRLTPAQLRKYTAMASKANAIARVQTAHGGIDVRKPPIVTAIEEATASVQWSPDDAEGDAVNFAEARRYVDQWLYALRQVIPVDSPHVPTAIGMMVSGIQHRWIRQLVQQAMKTGNLPGADPDSQHRWQGRAHCDLEAIKALVVEAARVQDYIEDKRAIRRAQKQLQMLQMQPRPDSSAKADDHYPGVSTRDTARAFLPSTSLTQQELDDINEASSDEDTLSAEVWAEVVDKMTSSVREQTIHWMEAEAKKRGQAVSQRLRAVLRAVPPRQPTPSGEHNESARGVDKLLQRQLVRKVSKWDKAVTKATQERFASPSKTSTTSKFSLDDAQRMHGHQREHQHAQPRRGTTHVTKNARDEHDTPSDYSWEDNQVTQHQRTLKAQTQRSQHASTAVTYDYATQWSLWTPLQRQIYRELEMDGLAVPGVTIPKLPEASMINISTHHEPPPSCIILMTAGGDERALWQNHLVDYDHRVKQYRQAHPWFYPTLSKWVHPDAWRDISENLLDEDQQTDKGPPNDLGVEELLRQEGRYRGRQGEKGKVLNPQAMEQLQELPWVRKATHLMAFQTYMAQWQMLTRTMYKDEIPPEKIQADIMLKAVKPVALHKAISNRLYSGYGPYKRSKVKAAWRLKARKESKTMKALIREHAIHWDDMGFVETYGNQAPQYVPKTNDNGSTNSNQQTICKAAGCNTPTTRKKRGGGF